MNMHILEDDILPPVGKHGFQRSSNSRNNSEVCDPKIMEGEPAM
jgi:hypothetical protein